MLSVKLKGFKEAQKKFKDLGTRRAKQIYRKGVRAATTVVLKTARPLVQKESGALKKSLGSRIKTRKRDKAIVGIVGPRQKFQKEWKGKIRKPSKYAHLAENGRKSKVGFSLTKGPFYVRGTRGTKFLARASRLSQGNALKAMGDKLKEELELL